MAAADTARLVAQLLLDDKQFQAAVGRSISGTQKLDSTLSKVGQRGAKGLSTAANNIAKIGALGSGLLVTGLALSVNEASNLNEQINKSAVVFGKASKEVLEFSKTTASGLGLSQSAALEAAGAFGNMFNTVGLTNDQSADFSQTMVQLAADMASFNNEDPTEMLDRLRSGLSGEAEPLRRFGVLLSEAAVQAEAYATGIAETGEKLTEAQKVQARYSLILKQTKVQQGDFARTSESLANQQRILKASLQNTAATIGTALLPKITEIAIKINKVLQENQPAIQKFADQLPAAFDKALAFAEKLPWEQIGKGLETAAFFAGKLVDVFVAMPPEVQATLIALAGLNKLSGGAITGIVGELGKGLIKGVLGMTAGVVNINAGVVNGVGGVPGVGGQTGGGVRGAIGSAVKTAAVVVPPLVIAAELQPAVTQAIAGDNVLTNPGNWLPPNDDPKPFWELVGKNTTLTASSLKEQKALSQQQAFAIRDATAQGAEKNRQAAAAVRDAVNTKVGFLASVTEGVRSAVNSTTAAARAAGQQAAFAIRDKDLSVSVATTNVINNTISVRETIKTTTTHKQYARYLS